MAGRQTGMRASYENRRFGRACDRPVVDLVLDALRMAFSRHRAGPDVQLVHHSETAFVGSFKTELIADRV